MSGISVAGEKRVFQTKEIARTKSYKHKRAQCVLPFGKQCSPGVESRTKRMLRNWREKKIGKRIWAGSNREYINLRVSIRAELGGCD